MESKLFSQTSPSFRLKRQIPISYQKQKPIEVIYLRNNHCLIQFKTAYIKINLSSKTQFTTQTIDITKFNGGLSQNFRQTSKPYPHPNGQFIFGLRSMYLYTGNTIVRMKKRWDNSYPDVQWNTLIFFHNSGLLLHTYSAGGNCPTYFEIIADQKYKNQQNRFLQKVPQQDHPASPADSDSLFIANVNRKTNTIKIVDFLNRQKIRNVTLPFQVHYHMAFYILNSETGIAGILNQQSVFEIFLVELKENGQMNKLTHFENIQNAQFVLINKARSIIVIELLSKDLSVWLILFNYQSKNIVWKHLLQSKFKRKFNDQDKFHPQSMKFNQDLSKFLAIQIKGYEYKLVQYQQTDLKKTYFHLFKKSNLSKSFGERMGRELLKVLI